MQHLWGLTSGLVLSPKNCLSIGEDFWVIMKQWRHWTQEKSNPKTREKFLQCQKPKQMQAFIAMATTDHSSRANSQAAAVTVIISCGSMILSQIDKTKVMNITLNIQWTLRQMPFEFFIFLSILHLGSICLKWHFKAKWHEDQTLDWLKFYIELIAGYVINESHFNWKP